MYSYVMSDHADSGRILITYSADAVQAARFKPYNASYYLLIDLKKTLIL